MFRFLVSFFIILSSLDQVLQSLAMVRSQTTPASPNTTGRAHLLNNRQDFGPITTCGYLNGDPKSARTADLGYGCRVDTALGIWGFCPTSVLSARDCGLAAFCMDNHSCTAGCGRLSNQIGVTTFSCEKTQFCSTALLRYGPDRSYEYIACGRSAGTDTLFAVPNTVEASTTSSPSATPSISLTSPKSLSSPSSTQGPSTLISSITTLPRLSSPSSAPDSTAASSAQNTTNTGAIVGGVIGGLSVICLTILGVLLIRRKRGTGEKSVKSPGYAYDDQSAPVNDTEYSSYRSVYAKKGGHWDSSHGPVEMHAGYSVTSEPIELMGNEQSSENILKPR